VSWWMFICEENSFCSSYKGI